MKHNTSKYLMALLLTVCLALGTLGCGETAAEPETQTQTQTQTTAQQTTEAPDTETLPTEPGSVALPTKYIVLSYPEEIKDLVTVTYEDMADGQTVIFTTDFTGETLELFRFFIGKSADDGYVLGFLEDPEEGTLTVCATVQDYSNGNWEPEVYNQLIDLQTRVNDIIVRFHEDERFVPNV